MKVYISSTYRDLREHRAAVALALRRMGHDVIGLEEYVAEGMTPLKRCLDDVRRSDAYVVIVGWRYGYVPVDTNLNPDKRSITELELGATRDAGRAVLAFLVDPDAPWPPTAIDALSEAGGAQIRRLRADVGSEYLVGTFSTPDNLASQVIVAVAAQGANRHLGERALDQAAVSESMAAFVRGVRCPRPRAASSRWSPSRE